MFANRYQRSHRTPALATAIQKSHSGMATTSPVLALEEHFISEATRAWLSDDDPINIKTYLLQSLASYQISPTNESKTGMLVPSICM